IKYENVYLHAYATVGEAKAGIGKYLTFFNEKRPHSSLDGQVPDTVYFASMPPLAKAA
ncbi:MAG: transposase, partial [Lautropia sp.]|nr:transposase [Lautropia sp.]